VDFYFAGGGIDYDSGPYIVTFPARVTSVSFDIAINNDNILELTDEKFDLTISQSSLPTGFTVGNPNRAMVNIKDDDSEFLSYSSKVIYFS